MENKTIPLRIAGVGYSVPETVIKNDDLKKLYETSDEWIYTRTGIKERRVVSGNETAIDLGLEASKQAIEKSKINIDKIDCIMVSDNLFESGKTLIIKTSSSGISFRWVQNADEFAAYANTLIEEYNHKMVSDNISDYIDAEYFDAVFNAYIMHNNDIDDIIDRFSKGWRIDRIAKVDLSVLRICIAEIKYLKAPVVPVSVSISEAVRIAKIYGGEDSGKFVNGILGRISRENSDAN